MKQVTQSILSHPASRYFLALAFMGGPLVYGFCKALAMLKEVQGS